MPAVRVTRCKIQDETNIKDSSSGILLEKGTTVRINFSVQIRRAYLDYGYGKSPVQTGFSSKNRRRTVVVFLNRHEGSIFMIVFLNNSISMGNEKATARYVMNIVLS